MWLIYALGSHVIPVARVGLSWARDIFVTFLMYACLIGCSLGVMYLLCNWGHAQLHSLCAHAHRMMFPTCRHPVTNGDHGRERVTNSTGMTTITGSNIAPGATPDLSLGDT